VKILLISAIIAILVIQALPLIMSSKECFFIDGHTIITEDGTNSGDSFEPNLENLALADSKVVKVTWFNGTNLDVTCTGNAVKIKILDHGYVPIFIYGTEHL